MSLIYPLRHIYITQVWGVNGQIYSKFGYKGHNGVDFRLFNEKGVKATTAILYAPHSGKVLEARNDSNGYGLYLKIENEKEGSILAHLKSMDVKEGDLVIPGQKIGICDNTGWSTGAHLHWGYYTLPRNRNNGYGGTINQTDLPIMTLDEWESNMTLPEEGYVFEDIEGLGRIDFRDPAQISKVVEYYLDEKKRTKDARDEKAEIKAELATLKNAYENEIADYKAEKEELKSQAEEHKFQYKEYVAWLSKTLGTQQDQAMQKGIISKLILVEDNLVSAQTAIDDLTKTNIQLTSIITDLKEEIISLKESLKNAKGIYQATNDEIAKEYWKRKIEFTKEKIKLLTDIIRRN